MKMELCNINIVKIAGNQSINPFRIFVFPARHRTLCDPTMVKVSGVNDSSDGFM